MRWPIRIQLLVPMLAIVALAITLATVASVYLTVAGASRRQAGQLRRVVAATTEANFPLTETVLQQMRGLSGGQFVLLDDNRKVVHGTIRLDADALESLRAVDADGTFDSFSSASVVRLSGNTYLADLVPVRRRTGAGGTQTLLVLYPKDRWWSIAREVAHPILWSGAIAMVVGGLVAAVLAGRFARPIRVIGDRAMAIAAGHFKPVALPARDDEIADLAVSINTMMERLSHYEEEVRRTERMRTLGQLGAGMAHQLRNSATGVRMAIELHQRECPEAAHSESTAVAMRELRLMESYLRSFLDLGQARRLPHERVDLGSVVQGVLELVRPTCKHAGIDLAYHQPPQPVFVKADDESLRQLLVNLVLNATEAVARHADGAARVVVELERSDGNRAVVRVNDSGPGPCGTLGDDLFEPFVTGKPDGTGLGLYVARQIAEAHHGSIRWQRLENMTCFTVEIPLADARTHPGDTC
ncbi:MAG: HAMP domain-containing histidine kinase [Pirellulales bacterium]|nr:HAMP domain-containing histidine kinase [Pirellulales bacterium]